MLNTIGFEVLKFSVNIIVFFSHVSGLRCSTAGTLKKYDLERIIHFKEVLSTPPSITTMEWYINICNIDRSNMPVDCHDDDIICGLEWTTLHQYEPILTAETHLTNKKYSCCVRKEYAYNHANDPDYNPESELS